MTNDIHRLRIGKSRLFKAGAGETKCHTDWIDESKAPHRFRFHSQDHSKRMPQQKCRFTICNQTIILLLYVCFINSSLLTAIYN